MGIVEKNYEDLQGMCSNIAAMHLGGPAGVDHSAWANDIAQDVIVLLLEKEAAGTLREEDMFGLAKEMARTRSINFSIQEKRRREIEQEHGKAINRSLTGQSAESLAADPFDGITREEALDRLCALSPLLYHTTRRHYIDGWTVCRIAETDGVTTDVVYKRLQRARDIVTGDNNNE